MRTLSIIVAATVLSGAALGSAYAADDPVRGVVRAVRDATIATELNARVLTIGKREGEAFEPGDLLLEFDCQRQRAELEAAQAEDAVNKIGYDNALELDRRKSIGKFDLRAAKSRWEKARATAASIAAVVKNCRIVAPFRGRLTDLRIREHEMSAPGQPLFRIVDGDDLELDFIVPSNWLVWLKVGSPLAVKVDETGATHEAQVKRIAAAVDPVSQTIKITAAFTKKASGALPGMSVAAIFDAPGN